jgi:hypothetical protein
VIQKHTTPKAILAGLLTIILLSVSCQATACAAYCELAHAGSKCHGDAGHSSHRNARAMDQCAMTGETSDAHRLTLAAVHHGCEEEWEALPSSTEVTTTNSRSVIPANDVFATSISRPALFKHGFSSHLSLERSHREAFGSRFSVLRV